MSAKGENTQVSLSEVDRGRVRQSAHIALARKDYLGYATYIDPTYKTPDHIRLLGGYLNMIESGDLRRLIIVMPPQHGKSEATSGKFPGYFIGRDPSRRVMITSYASDLAETFSRQNRDTISDNPRWAQVFPDVVLSPTRRNAAIWGVNHERESCMANGVLGGMTGYGATLIIFDDPIKNYEQAQSATIREKVWAEFQTSARTRVTPDWRIVIIMTRWHEDDLVGRVLASPEADQWTVLHLPAISYGTLDEWMDLYPNPKEREAALRKVPKTAFPDPLNRPKGEALWPEYKNLIFLEEQRTGLEEKFEPLYQGNPGKPEGTKFKRDWFRPITPDVLKALKPERVKTARSYDLAWSESQRADSTASVKGTLYKLHYDDRLTDVTDETVKLQLEQMRDIPPLAVVLTDGTSWKAEWDEASEWIIEAAQKDGKGCGIYMEAVASQNTGVKSLRKDVRMMNYKLYGVTVSKDKEERAKYPLKLASKGMVFVLKTGDVMPTWYTSFIDEVTKFPHAPHDDWPDAFTQLVNKWQPTIDRLLRLTKGNRWVKKPTEPKGRPPEFREAPRVKSSNRLGWCK